MGGEKHLIFFNSKKNNFHFVKYSFNNKIFENSKNIQLLKNKNNDFIIFFNIVFNKQNN
jgi:hypothetical protein